MNILRYDDIMDKINSFKVVIFWVYYNDTVLKYNTALQVFPSNLFAGMLGFKTYEFYQAKEMEAVAIKIDSMSF